VASGWIWLNLALVLVLADLIRLAVLVCERSFRPVSTGDPGRCDHLIDRSASGWSRKTARWLAKVSCWPDSTSPPGGLLRKHFPQGAPLVCDGQTGYPNDAFLISPRPILWGPHVLGMGV
jgi:hypothetical protein